jgi:hypothetical protein
MRRASLKQYGKGSKPLDVQEAKETPPRHRSNKDTRKWCRGHRGRAHIVYWRSEYYAWAWPPHEGMWHANQTLICIACGKHLKWRTKNFKIEGGGDEQRGA